MTKPAGHLRRLAAVLLLALGILLPSVAPAFASPALTPEQGLARDIALSLCSEGSGSAPSDKRHGKDCDLCVLCRSLAAASLPSTHGLVALESAPSDVAMHFHAAWRVPAVHPLDSATGPPRAPPHAS
jgi:hypothetical protein